MLLVGPISHSSTQKMDFVEIFNISLDLSFTYCAHFSHSILERYNLFSGVKLSIRSLRFISERLSDASLILW